MNLKWSKTELGELIDTLKGCAFKSKDYVSEGIPIARVSDFTEDSISEDNLVYLPESLAKEYSIYKLQHNNVIIQTVGSWQYNPASVVGKVIKVPKKLSSSLLNQNAVKLIPHDNVDERFLFYRLKDETFKAHVLGCAQGAANQASITLSTIRRFKFFIPPFDVQQKIAAILCSYDDLIENNLKRIKLLEEMAQITYEEWFVRLKYPGHETTPIDSETGLPVGWKIKKLGEILTLNYGKSLTADVRSNGSVPVYGSAGIVGVHNESIVKGPGVIVGRKGNVGSIFWSYDDFYPIDTVFFVSSELPLLYIRFLLSYIEFVNNDAAVPGLNRNSAYLIKCAIPTLSLIERFEKFVTPLFQTIRNLNSQNQLLKEARDILLPRLMTGMIDVDTVGADLSA